MVTEEVLRDLDMDAGAIAGLAVGIDGAPVPHRLQRIDAGRHHVAAALAVERHDQADAAGVDLLGGVVAVGGGELGDTGLVVANEILCGHNVVPFTTRHPDPSEAEGGGLVLLLTGRRTSPSS